MNKNYSTLFWLLIFLPLISATVRGGETTEQVSLTLPELIYNSTEHFSNIDSANLDGLLNRIGDSRLVLLGEASHGTAEFYDMRARITRELIEKKGFTIIALEADWSNADSINYLVSRSGPNPMFKNRPFTDFPDWMWGNQSVAALVRWLKGYNQSVSSAVDAVGLYGLDLQNLFGSIEAVLNYLQDVDPNMAQVAGRHYSCLLPWANDPLSYSREMQSGRFRGCGYAVSIVLQNLLNNQAYYRQVNQQNFFSALQNARLVKNAEHYYLSHFFANNNAWNQRDQYMFETLLKIMDHRGQTSKVIVWAHNLHSGDARAMQMSTHGEFNLGQRVRETFGNSAYLIGFGAHHGTVAAASEWGGPMKVMHVATPHRDSYESLFHQVKVDNFLLPLRYPVQNIVREKLQPQRLQRGIGVVYDPKLDLTRNYTYASLADQFDEYIWFDETRAVQPLSGDIADTPPFGLY